VKISASWFLVSIGLTKNLSESTSFDPFETWSRNQWNLHAKCLERGVTLGNGMFANLSAPSLSSQMVEWIGMGDSMGKFTLVEISCQANSSSWDWDRLGLDSSPIAALSTEGETSGGKMGFATGGHAENRLKLVSGKEE